MQADDDSRLLLQKRLTLVFAILSGVSLLYALSDIAVVLMGAPAGSPAVPLANLLICVCNGALALRCRSRPRTLRELHLLDAAATAVTCWVIAAMLSQVEPPAEASVSLQLSVTYVLLARAVLLPSSGLRTLVVCLVALVPGAAMATSWRIDALAHSSTVADWASHAYEVSRNLVLTTFLATLTSQVIYGLRRQVREIARVGQYVLHEKLGEGGMGVVYRATHALLRRDTAVKLLQPERVGEKSLARFEREVKLTARLTHPNTVAVYDYGRTPEGVFYYAMEHLDGGDLEQLVAYAGPLPPSRVVWILEQVCGALAEAHALGLIHRDIKPSNVLLCERGGEGDVAKLVDFGLVRDLNAPEAARLTHDKALTGTPLYMSPESITAPALVEQRSDLYSLGAVAYFLLTGEPPFIGRTVVDVCMAHMHQAPSAPSQQRPGVPAQLDAVVLRCLEKAPEARHPDASALLADLKSCAEEQPWTKDGALAWWREHGDKLKRHRVGAAASALGTTEQVENMTAGLLRVDFDERGSRH
jgi:serine/threonine protein kinase